MEPEDKRLLEKTLEVSEENNRLLKEVEKGIRWNRVFSIVRIVIILLPFVLGFLYLLPFIQKLNDFYSVFGSGTETSETSTDAISDIWTRLKQGL